jgi:ceramide glucosyltransferase
LTPTGATIARHSLIVNLLKEAEVTPLFYILLTLLILQGVFALVEGIKFLAFVRRSLAAHQRPFAPKAAIIAPCKGVDHELAENLAALCRQDYTDYEIIFVIASPDDPARPLIEKVVANHTRVKTRLVIAKENVGRSEKVNNLLCALDEISPDTAALVFVDSDARVRRDWLRQLVAPLADERVGAATGYRWYLPARPAFWSAILSAWNGSVATTLGDGKSNFAWGGSTAILRKTFDTAGVRARWQSAASDDYALTRAVEDAGLRIVFEPRCLLVSRENLGLRELLEFTTRQIIITRVYRPRAWWVGIISQAIFCAVFFGGLATVFISALQSSLSIITVAALAVIYLLGSAKGVLRTVAASSALAGCRDQIIRLWWAYCLLWPLVSLVFFYNFARSAMTRRITWRGVRYELRSPTETVIIR